MRESEYKIRDLTVDNALDALAIQERITGELSAYESATFLDLIEIDNEKTKKIGGAQNGLVVYERDYPISYLGISAPYAQDNTQSTGEIIVQKLGGFVTDPEYRSMSLLNTMFDHVISTQNPEFIYCYTADALLDTSYKGLKKPGVQRWLKRNDYSIVFKEYQPEQDIDPDLADETRPVFLYPALWDSFIPDLP